jgi:hypothetical protein
LRWVDFDRLTPELARADEFAAAGKRVRFDDKAPQPDILVSQSKRG